MKLRGVVTSLAIGLAACSRGDDAPDAPELPRTAADSAAADAGVLGAEITRLYAERHGSGILPDADAEPVLNAPQMATSTAPHTA